MQVRITRPGFRAVPDNEVYPRSYQENEVVSGSVASAALEQGAGEEVKAARPAFGAAEEDGDDHAAGKKAPANKSSAPPRNKA